MVLALTWSGWSGLMASVGVILAAVGARHAWRAAVREELLDYLAQAAPEVAITGVRVGSLVYQARDGADAPRTIALDAVLSPAAARTRGGTAEAEAARRRGRSPPSPSRCAPAPAASGGRPRALQRAS